MVGGVSHSLDVWQRAALLHRLMIQLAGNAYMSLEGDLSSCRFTDDVVASYAETAVLKRNTLAPEQGFVVLRLTPETIDPIFRQVMTAGLKQAIIHVQIEREGMLELGAYDNFHRESVVTGPGISVALLDELKDTKVLRGFKAITLKR
jgi:hypothetical protein